MQPINAWSDTQYAPVPGLSEMLMQRNRDTQQAFQDIGRFGGALGAGVIGAVQGNRNPQVFAENGQVPSGGMAGLKGGLKNFRYALTGEGENMKQFAAMGKMADTTRSLLDAQTPRMPDQQPKVMGYTDDEWKHLGTADKVQAFQATKQAMDQKTALLGYDTAMQHFAQIQQQMKEQQASQQADDKFNAGYAQLTQPVNLGKEIPANGPVASPYMQQFAAVASNPPPLNGPEMLRLAAVSGMSPEKGLILSREALNNAKAQRELTTEQAGANFIEDPTTGARFLGRGNTTLPSGINPDKMRGEGPTISPDGQFFHNGKTWTHIKSTGAPAGSKFVSVDGVVSLMSPDGRVLDWKMENPMAGLLRENTGTPGNGVSQSGAPVSMVWDAQKKRYVMPGK